MGIHWICIDADQKKPIFFIDLILPSKQSPPDDFVQCSLPALVLQARDIATECKSLITPGNGLH